MRMYQVSQYRSIASTFYLVGSDHFFSFPRRVFSHCAGNGCTEPLVHAVSHMLLDSA